LMVEHFYYEIWTTFGRGVENNDYCSYNPNFAANN